MYGRAIEDILESASMGNVLNTALKLRKWGITTESLYKARCHLHALSMVAISTLVEAGIDPTGKVSNGKVCFCNAVAEAKPNIISYLILLGADVNAKDNLGVTPLISAATSANPTVVKLLLRKGADVNHTTNSGHTALHYAVGLSDYTSTMHLLQHGADPYIVNADGCTAEDLVMGENLNTIEHERCKHIFKKYVDKAFPK